MSPPTWSKYDLMSNITIVVGHDQQDFTCPKNIMMANSTYLRTACEHSQDDVVCLPPDIATVDTFLSFYEFCVKGTITSGTDELATSNNYTELIQLYALAKLLGSATLANHCVEKVFANFEASDEAPEVRDLVLAWDLLALGEKCGLKQLLADLWASSAGGVQVEREYEMLPKQFLAMMFSAKGKGDVTAEGLHEYMDHEGEEEAYEAVDRDDKQDDEDDVVSMVDE